MKKFSKIVISLFITLVLVIPLVACGVDKCKVAESVKLTSAMLGEVEFTNAETVSLNQNCDTVNITGTVSKMSSSQTNAFGNEDVTHVVVLKFEFDKERTLSSFEIKGSTTKVFSTNSSDENYAGSLTQLLDNEAGEDAYANLILSASTQSYTLTAKYSDATTSIIKLNINATLASAQ